MRMLSFLSAEVYFVLLLFILPGNSSNLYTDRQALLNFAALVPHSRKLNWNSSTSVCNSWVGITCGASRVVAVRLPGIGLYGAVPANTLGRMDALTTLSLRSNVLNGSLPADLLSLPSLQYVYLQRNSFSGAIPSALSPQLNTLDLSFNSFSGRIPATLQNLTQLTTLSLQNNSLTGPIPEHISGVKQLNLSNNHLNGSIPTTLRSFPASSFGGNTLLCGQPLDRCPTPSSSPSPSPSPGPSPSPSPFPSPSEVASPPSTILPPKPDDGSKRKLSRGSIAAIAVGSAAALLFLLLVVMTFCFKKRDRNSNAAAAKKGTSGRSELPKEAFSSGVQEAEKNKLVFFEGSLYSFDLEDLLRASAEVLGKGSYGTTYKAILEDGTAVVVKRLREVVVGKREFEQQMENLGRIGQHPNVVALRAYYYSKDEKLLVYDYLPAGSFSTLLHGTLFRSSVE